MVPLVMANIDYGISNRNMGYIGKMGLVLLLLGVVGLASPPLRRSFSQPRQQWGYPPNCGRHCLTILRISELCGVDKACPHYDHPHDQ